MRYVDGQQLGKLNPEIPQEAASLKQELESPMRALLPFVPDAEVRYRVRQTDPALPAERT